MKRVTIGLLVLVAIGVSQSGCGSRCDRADDRIIKHYEDCKISVAAESGSGNAVCSDAGAVYLECRADCVEAASCEALNGTDFEAAADFGKCNADCEAN